MTDSTSGFGDDSGKLTPAELVPITQRSLASLRADDRRFGKMSNKYIDAVRAEITRRERASRIVDRIHLHIESRYTTRTDGAERTLCGVPLTSTVQYVPPKRAQFVTCKRCLATLRKM